MPTLLPVVGALFLAACGSGTREVLPDGGLILPDAAVYVDAMEPDAAVPVVLEGCSPTPDQVVTIVEGEFGGVGLAGSQMYVGRMEPFSIYERGKLYAAPKTGGLATQLLQLSKGAVPREIKSDGVRIYFHQQVWRAIEFDGTPSDFLNGLQTIDLEVASGRVFVTGSGPQGERGLWSRSSDAATPWEVVVEGRFHGPLDVAGGVAVTNGQNAQGFADFEHVFRIDLSNGEIQTWAWGRDQIHSLIVDGPGAYWVEGLSKDNYQLLAPLTLPSYFLPAGYGGVGHLRATPTHLDYAFAKQGYGHLARYDRTSTNVDDLIVVPYFIRNFLEVDGYIFVMRRGVFNSTQAIPGALFRFDSADLSAPPLEVTVPTFEPFDLVTDGEFVYWTDEGELLHPGSLWRTRISDGSTIELLSIAWPRALVLVDRVIYLANSVGTWSYDLDDQELRQLQQSEGIADIATDGEYVYWGANQFAQMYRYLPGAAAPELLFAGVHPFRSIITGDQYLYWIDGSETTGEFIGRGLKDGSGAAERFIPHLDGAAGMFLVADRLVYSHVNRGAFMSLPKSGTGMTPRVTPRLTEVRTINDEQFAITFEGLAIRTPVTGELTSVWGGGGANVKGYAADDDHILVVTPDRILCITR